MKLAIILISASFMAAVHSKAVQAPLHLISLEDLTEEDRRQLEILNKEAAANRNKRSGSGSGSGELLATIAQAIGKTLKRKITQIARSSASASAHFSSGLSGGSGHGGGHHDEHPVPHKDDSFDWWALKKSILNTLLQAVKAIKGGVIAINGQLLKGSGYLISAKGRLLASKGDSVTELGKKIASSALLSPHPSQHGAVTVHEGHVEEHPPISSYGPPPTHYGVPTASAPAYYHHAEPSSPGIYEPQKFSSHYDDSVAYGAESGIVILKKIPKGHQKSKHTGEESSIPEFKPLKTDDSEFSFKNIVGKFFHASTSLQPDELTEQTDNTDAIEVEPPQDYLEAHKSPAPIALSSYDDSQPHSASPSTSYTKYIGLLNKKPNTFETVNYETHPELYEQDTKSADYQTSSSQPLDSFKISEAELDFLKNYFVRHNTSQVSNATSSYDFSKDASYKPPESFPSYSGTLPADFIPKYEGYGLQPLPFGGFKLNPPDNPFEEIKSNSYDPRYKRYPRPSKQTTRFAPSQKARPVRPPQPLRHTPPPRQNFRLRSPPSPVNVVKSVTYELGPNGPIKV